MPGPYDVRSETIPSSAPGGNVSSQVTGGFGTALVEVAALGDSITANNTLSSATDLNHSTRGYLTYFRFLTRQRFYFPTSNNFGVAGDTTGQMISRLGDVIAAKPSLVFVLGGTNDVNSGVSPATAIANLTTIYNALSAAGIIILAIPILGRSGGLAFSATQLAQANQINHFIRSQASVRNGFYVVDCGAVFDDPVATTWADRSGYTFDGLHPSQIGAYAIGKRCAQIANSLYADWFYPVTNQSDRYDATNNPNGNVLTNGMFAGGTTLATGWTDASSMGGAAATLSKVTLADGRPAQKVVLSGSATGSNLAATIWTTASAASFSAGDQLEASVEVQISGLTGALSITPELQTVEGGTNYYVRDMQRVASNFMPVMTESGVMKTPARVLTQNPTNIYLFLRVYLQSPASALAISGDVTFASAAVRKVT